VVPFTIVVVMPVNRQLLAFQGDLSPAAIHERLQRWNTLHAVRTLLSLVATVTYV
jgi:hypothetical protein